MRDARPNARRPQWTEEEYRAYLQREGKAEHLPIPLKKQAVSKYRNQKVTIDGIQFDSKGEAARYQELRLMERAGLISGLQHHVRIPIIVNEHTICHYEADFVYCEKAEEVWEDYKGVETDIFRLKRRLIAACYGKEVRITKRLS